ncbi:MAG: response regulator [Natronomonas sp.]|uniref:response regulator n=1 Tax=Natronomonas sp. TaxID=2184060 RepID=UPI0028702AE9|nr:response regulator [Natronomonas sp.]MDR9380588.1 response regulator [Natronomonas sp.]MDR9429587.1 response regulator [Natronomonas sp.]
MSYPKSEPTPTGPSAMPIEVLLVDDDERWSEILASDLEREANLKVTVALSANEALMTLQERSSIECVVADYVMPEIDGLQLLERVREERSELPFIFFTGQGSEDVASRAINAGISDYFTKDPTVDQTPLLVNRIIQAVEQRRLQRDLEASEERYRTITEQIWDGIVILRNDRVLFCNERFTKVTGYDAENMADRSFVRTAIHPDDRAAVNDALQTARSGNANGDVFEARLITDTDELRECEYTIQTVPFENDTAQVVSVRDVTESKRRQRSLRRERELNRSVRTALVKARNRSDLEHRITALLSESGYELAWIGETTDDSIQLRRVAGTARYLDRVTLSVGAGAPTGEPSIWTARTGDPKFVADISEMFPTTWRDLAMECGFGSAAALPLCHNGVRYGILAVYHAESNAIDESERELLTELSETLAFAIHHAEVKKALSAPTVVEAELELTGPSHYLTDLVSESAPDVAAAELTVHGTHRHTDALTMQYITLSNVPIDRFVAAAETHPVVEKTTAIDENNPPRIQLAVTEAPPELKLTTRAAVVGTSTVRSDRAILRVELPSERALSDAVAALEDEHGDLSVRSKITSTRPESAHDWGSPVEAADLTEKQSAALQAAYLHGYYEQPRERSATEIAESLGIAHSTYLQHLRTAQQKVFKHIYESTPERQARTAE